MAGKNENRPKNSSLTDAAQTLGSAGGKEGGPARANALTAAERSNIARQGGNARAGKGKSGK